jgi:hypothetical protein
MHYPQQQANCGHLSLWVFLLAIFTILAIVKILEILRETTLFYIVNPLVKSRQTQYRLEFQAI